VGRKRVAGLKHSINKLVLIVNLSCNSFDSKAAAKFTLYPGFELVVNLDLSMNI